MIRSDIWHKYHDCDISKLLYVISRAVWRVRFETSLKYHERYYAKYHLQIVLFFVYTTTEMQKNTTSFSSLQI